MDVDLLCSAFRGGVHPGIFFSPIMTQSIFMKRLGILHHSLSGVIFTCSLMKILLGGISAMTVFLGKLLRKALL